MCVFVATILGALAAGAEVVALEAQSAREATDGSGAFVSVAASCNSALLPSDH